jgi:ankyrin repeat protein
MSAAETGQMEMARMLVEHGANVNDRGRVDLTALHEACRFGQVEMVEYLISLGADVNTEAEGGWRPLDIASHRIKHEIVEILKRHGARHRQRD